ARAQNALGFINDVDVAKAALVKLAGGDSEMRSAAAFICGWHSPRYARLCRRSIRELEPLLYARAPWNR
ncbi:MAG TPA: inorganic triphosphatase, partial [Rhodocyclaceae bacterium]|nr:inorganic triphosphatase [Rhodocyclaceae bacterium]